MSLLVGDGGDPHQLSKTRSCVLSSLSFNKLPDAECGACDRVDFVLR